MKFLADQDVFAATIRFLEAGGHDVLTATQAGLSQADDVDLLQAAHVAGRVMITRDRDFGSLVFCAWIELRSHLSPNDSGDARECA